MQRSHADELFQRTLTGDYDDETPWEAVRELQRLGGREIFKKAATWCKSEEPLKRARGADVLGQLGKTAENRTTSFALESFGLLTTIVAEEKDPLALSSAIAALGHLENSDAIPFLLPFAEHPDANVRHFLAFSLGCFANDTRCTSILIMLMQDADSDVRDWATFGLGTLSEIDSAEIRDALFRNLSDQNRDVREEAMAGMAKRGDKRVLPALIAALQQEGPSYCVMEAALSLLGDDETNRNIDSTGLVNTLRSRFPKVLKT